LIVYTPSFGGAKGEAMALTNVCEYLNCSYYRKGQQRNSLNGYGCARYNSASTCTVSEIKGVEASEYRLTTAEDLGDTIRTAAMRATCPDPIVRLAALAEYPVEPSANFIANSEAYFDGAGDRLKVAIKNLRIGPGAFRDNND
jgi:hypothetical protein